jgi:hypothetical protein
VSRVATCSRHIEYACVSASDRGVMLSHCLCGGERGEDTACSTSAERVAAVFIAGAEKDI